VYQDVRFVPWRIMRISSVGARINMLATIKRKISCATTCSYDEYMRVKGKRFITHKINEI
jgi:hypothetical protein